MTITYRNYVVAINDESQTATIMDRYDSQFQIEQEGGYFIVTETKNGQHCLVLETDNIYNAFQFVKDWT